MRKDITTDAVIITEILTKADTLWLAIVDEEGPYSIPVNHVYTDGILYIHTGMKGRKYKALQSGNVLGFSTAIDLIPKTGEKACQFGYKFRSVIGTGRPSELAGDAKRHGLDAITLRYAGELLEYNERVLEKTAIFSITVDSATARIKE